MTTNERAERIFRNATTTCDPGMALDDLLDVLVEANLQEDDTDDGSEEGSDEYYARKSEAETVLFLLATMRRQEKR